MGDADAFVSGLPYDYPDVIRPALQIHHTRSGNTRAAGVYIMIVEDRVYLFTDATVNIDPTAEDLAEIACLAANFAKQLELEPRVAFLSFSNFGSTPHPLSDKVGWRGSKVPITAVVANLANPSDAGTKKALARVRRTVRQRSAF